MNKYSEMYKNNEKINLDMIDINQLTYEERYWVLLLKAEELLKEKDYYGSYKLSQTANKLVTHASDVNNDLCVDTLNEKEIKDFKDALNSTYVYNKYDYFKKICINPLIHIISSIILFVVAFLLGYNIFYLETNFSICLGVIAVIGYFFIVYRINRENIYKFEEKNKNYKFDDKLAELNDISKYEIPLFDIMINKSYLNSNVDTFALNYLYYYIDSLAKDYYIDPTSSEYEDFENIDLGKQIAKSFNDDVIILSSKHLVKLGTITYNSLESILMLKQMINTIFDKTDEEFELLTCDHVFFKPDPFWIPIKDLAKKIKSELPEVNLSNEEINWFRELFF